MKDRLAMEIRSFCVVGFLLFFSNLAFAVLPPTNPRLEDIDKRLGASSQPATISPAQGLALDQLHARQQRARVEFDPVTGSPKSIEAGSEFLSGSNGVGRSVPAAAAPAFASTDPDRATKAFLEEYRGLFQYGPEALDSARVIRDSTMARNGLRTVVWQQHVDGIPVFDAVLISHTTRRGELVNLSSQFLPDASGAVQRGGQNRANLAASLKFSAAQALVIAAGGIGEPLSEGQLILQPGAASREPGATQAQVFRAPGVKGDATVSLTWLPMNSSQLRLCWDVILMGRSTGEMFRVLVDTATGEALVRHCLTTDVSDATYRVYTSDSPMPFSPGYPTPTTRQPPAVGRSLVTLPALDVNASPNGWIDDGVNETRGNNVDAHTDLNNDNQPDLPRPQGSPFRVFDFPLDLNTQPTNYRSAAVVQLFYWCNWMHDQLYDLGFTEAAGNFQNTNFNRGGVGGDAVQADAQDGGGLNNANFSTPPDGLPGWMQMYVFTGSGPNRDGDLDAEVVLHEYTHGLSNRRVGGGVGISTLQPEGMGEGWSDFYALALLSEPGDDIDGNYAMAAYALQNYYFGIRRYPYSTDPAKNPLTFKDIDNTQASSHPGIPRNNILAPANEVHNMGEVWCVTLWDARANLVRKYGWATGNRLILQLVTDGMTLSAPNPTFLQARDAILQADMVDTGGTNQIELWEAFAKRGLGTTATCPDSTSTAGVQESFEVPDDLQVNPFSGGSFSYQSGKVAAPTCLTYQLSNVGSNVLHWSAIASEPWISLDVTNGVIAPGNSNAVTVCLNSTAENLFGGDYFGSVAFSNTVSGFTHTRPLSLHLTPPQVLFYPLDTQSVWSINGEWQFGQPAGFGGSQYGHADPASGATGTNVYGINLNGDYSLSVGNSNYLTAGPFDFSGFTEVSLHFQRWLNSDFQPYVFETIEVSTDGTNWNPVWDNGLTEIADNSWTPVSYDLSTWVDNHANVYVRWGHRVASTLAFPYSGWNIDDVEFWGDPRPRLSINIPSPADVSSGVQTGTLTVTPPSLTNLTVTLASSDAGVAGVPDSVLIPAGASSAAFNLELTNQLVAPPSATVTITASAPNYLSASGDIQLSDSNAVTLHLLLPDTVLEGDGSLTGAAAIRDPQTNDVVIALSSSNPSALQIPDSVTITQGQTSVVFSVTVIDDTAINGSRSVTVTGQSSGWSNGVAAILVQDNENLNLTVTAPANAWENAGALSNAGTVSISGTLTTDLIVSLAPSVPAKLAVPDNVTIAAGQTSASFDITPIDNLVSDGNQAVSIGASAAGFTNGSASITILDDEAPPAASNPSPSDLATNVDPVVALVWQNGYLPGAITNDVYFGVNPTPGPAELVGSTTNLTWTLPLLAPQTTYYWQVLAHHVGIAAGPVWRFTTRGVGHFTWAPISSPQYVNQPFAVTVTALDAHDSIVSNYTGTVQLQGSPAEISPAVSGAFVDGIWQGNVTVAQLASGEILTAADGAGHTNASDPFDVVLTNDVSIGISASTNPAPVGAPLTYILTITNTGAAVATQVQVTDLLPPRAIVNSVTVSQGSWQKTNHVLTATLGTISGGTTATVTIELTPTTFGDVLTNVASVARAESEMYPENDVATNTTIVGVPALSIADTATSEGNSGTTNALFTVTLSAPSSDPVTISYTTADGSAHAGSDYIETNGVLVLPPGATNAVISVAVIGNLVVEPDRDFQVNLSDPTNAVLTRAQATAIILDGDKYSGTAGHFDWAAISPLQHAKVPFDVTITAIGSSGLSTGTFDRLIAFSTSIAGVRFHPAVSGTFTNGVWTGQIVVDDSVSGLILKADDYAGHSGLSAAFDVVPYNMPPAILSQPIGRIVTNGSALVLSVVADGTPPLSYQWTLNGTNVIDGTNSTLTLASAQLIEAGDYVVQVSNEFGTEQSSPADLSVGDPPLITAQPTNQTLVLGNPASFTVTVTGTEPLIYQWSHEGTDLTDATNATLTIPSAQLSDAGNYVVRVSNLFGTQISSNALLTVGIVPFVTTQPTNAAVAVGSNAAFTITADGSAPLTFQWTFNGTNVADATNSMLMLTNVQMTDAGEYAVQVFNAFGMDQSSNAVLAVGDPPLITAQPTNQTLVLGNPASFLVTATGTEPLNYQWNHEGTDLPDATNATLNIPSAQLSDAGNYAVRLSNLFGTQSSSNALLTVGIVPLVTTQPTNAAVAVGSDAAFTITADGTAPLTFQWTFNGTNVTDATNSTLMLTNVQMTAAGEYAVQVFNAFGMDQSSNAVLAVGDPPVITGQPTNQTLVLGTPASFTVTVTGTEPLNYQWSHQGADLPDATNATLAIPSAQLSDAGNYAVRISNLFGAQSSSNALLTVGIVPFVTTQPTNAAVAVGSDAAFTITADGSAPLTFQWSFNGTNVTDATNSTLMLTNVQMTAAGEYAVQVFNAFGMDQSSNAVLEVLPVCTPPPSGIVGWWSAEGSAVDSITGTAGSMTNVTFAPGKVGSAFLFNGTNGAVNLGDPSNLRFTNSFSIETWIRINNLPSAQQGQAQIFFRGQSDPCLDPYFLSLTADGTLRFHIADGSQTPCGVEADTAVVTTGQWIHVAAVLDATNETMSVFLNGELAVQVNTAMRPFADLQDGGAVIGNRISQNGVGEPFDGLIDELATYNRALSIDEIQAIRDSGSAGKCLMSPALFVQPADLAVAAGSNAVLESAASGSPPLYFQWSLNGTNILDATNSVLTLTNAQSADAGQYVVTVTNAAGSTASAPVTLTVVLPPVIVVQPANQALPAGTTALLSVIANGTMPFHYQWQRGGVDLLDEGRILGANSSTLIISNLLPTDADSYSVVITNLAGVAVSSNATLIVYEVDHFAWDPIPPARFVNVPFPVRIQALDISNNPVAAFPGPVFLTTIAGDPVSPSESGNFTNGVWSGYLTLTQNATGTVLTASDELDHVGYANAFDVVNLPVLTLQQSGRTAVISWSAYGPVFSPETSSDLLNWSAADRPIDLISTQYRIRVAITPTNAFYRLRFIGP